MSDRSICGGEHDWFSIAVDEDDLVAVDLFVESGVGELDVTLRSPDLASLVAGAADGDVESARYEAPQASMLLVDVFERGGDADAEYSSFVSVAAAGPCGTDEDAFEPNDVRADATAFGSDGPRSAWLCDAPDVFEVRVPPSSPSPLSATVSVGAGSGDLDVGLGFYGSDRNGAQSLPNWTARWGYDEIVNSQAHCDALAEQDPEALQTFRDANGL